MKDLLAPLQEGITVSVLKDLRLDWLLQTPRRFEYLIPRIRAAVQSDEELKTLIRQVGRLGRTAHHLSNRYRKFDRQLRDIADVRDEYSRTLEEILTEIDVLASKYESLFFWLCKVRKLGTFVKGALGLVKQAKEIEELAKVLEKAK